MKCQICGKKFSSVYNLKRHKKNIHGDDITTGSPTQDGAPTSEVAHGAPTSEEVKEVHVTQTPEGALNAPITPECIPTENMLVFKQLFICIVSGPTSCCKTYFITRLLQRARDKIQPSPDTENRLS